MKLKEKNKLEWIINILKKITELGSIEDVKKEVLLFGEKDDNDLLIFISRLDTYGENAFDEDKVSKIQFEAQIKLFDLAEKIMQNIPIDSIEEEKLNAMLEVEGENEIMFYASMLSSALEGVVNNVDINDETLSDILLYVECLIEVLTDFAEEEKE